MGFLCLLICLFAFREVAWYFGFDLMWIVVFGVELLLRVLIWVDVVVYYLRSCAWCCFGVKCLV